MAPDLPIDMRHPAVREYVALTRLQVLTPLSLLINIAAVVICATVVKPNLAEVSREYVPTSITPKTAMIATFVFVIYAAQIGYCILLVLVRKPETKATLTKGVGMGIVIANWLMALWPIFFVLELWLASTIILGALIATLVYANIVLLIYHAPVSSRPLDMIFIHAPARMLLLLPLNILFWQSLFITLGMYWDYGQPGHFRDYAWEGFTVVLLSNLLAMAATLLRKDIVWCIGTAWLDVAIWTARPKSTAVQTTAMVFTILLPVLLLLVYVWGFFRRKTPREGRIALPEDEPVVVVEEEPGRPGV